MIGAGNVSTHISRHLFSKGHRITCIYSRTLASATALAGELGCPGTNEPERVPEQADYYIVCVPDHALDQVLRTFRGRRGTWLHTAGAVDMEVFQGLFRAFGVLYPLQTLSKKQAIDLEQCPLLVEGSSGVVKEGIVALAKSLSTRVEEADSRSRRIIHLAAVFANNFTNHMVYIGQEILEEQGLDKELLHPILEETIRKILSLDAREAQTGPALRDDRATMQKHTELLKRHPEWEKLYTFISRDIGRSRDN